MNLSAETEAGLLAIMAGTDRRSSEARTALSELYSRHVRYVYAVLWRAFGKVFDDANLTDVVVDTFVKAHDWAYRLHRPDAVLSRFSAPSPDGVRRLVLAWLGVIATHCARAKLEGETLSASRLALYLEHYERELRRPAPPGGSEHSALLEAALLSLPPDDQAVLQACLPWYDVALSSFQMPRGAAASVAKTLGISPDALRQRRHRALERMREYFLQAGYPADEEGAAP